jgi:ABC-type cobalamin/Fe3+-siderophores transport system ATPase subunit
MEQWYEELDFEENPFSTNPSDFVKKMVGREEVLDELSYRVRSGSMVFVEGAEGVGKTILLRNIIRLFRGKGKVIFVDCSKLKEDLNIEKLLINKNGLLNGSILKKYPKNMILLLDNVTELSNVNTERLKFFFDEGNLRSIIFAGSSYDNAKFSDSLRQRIAKVIKLDNLEEYQILDMVRSRIGNINFFSDEVIEKIAELSKYNPKKTLLNCEEVAEYVIEKDEDVVTMAHVDKVLLGKETTESDVKSETSDENSKDEFFSEEDEQIANSDDIEDQECTPVECSSCAGCSSSAQDIKPKIKELDNVKVTEDEDDDDLSDFFDDDEESEESKK